MNKIKYLLLFIAIASVSMLSYKAGTNIKQKQAVLNQEKRLECPYKMDGGNYTEYATSANEVSVTEKPYLIDNPELVKMDEPFDFAEFKKQLYTLSTSKGWDERWFDVDKDGKGERIIDANIAMNHTPHIALIIKNNKVIFKAEGANIWISDDHQGQGFTLSRTVDWNTGETQSIRYLPKDNGFIPVWEQKSCWVDFE